MLSIAAKFALNAAPVSVVPMGNGHINQTYLLTDASGAKYTFQKINNNIFKDVEGLMRNIRLVTEYLRPLPGESLELVKTVEGKHYLEDATGFYRVYRFVEGLTLERAETDHDMLMCGEGFGGFQKVLSGFDASLLCEVIPRFHDTANRVALLEKAAAADKCGRFKEVKAEYDFVMERKKEASAMLDMLKNGELNLRVTHNDTKINNVLLDPVTHAPKCVIDLDTIMPGLAGNDFGDCIRSGATTAAEDEIDVSKVGLNLDVYRAFAKGFIKGCAGGLTANEIETLPLGAKLMTFECGTRFLTDYLEGDVYFRTSHPTHNIERCRTQFKLVAETERRWNEINAIIAEEANS